MKAPRDSRRGGLRGPVCCGQETARLIVAHPINACYVFTGGLRQRDAE